jgi:hypothetical protein
LLLWGNGCGFTWFFWENTVEMLVYDEWYKLIEFSEQKYIKII